jgi:putative ABC transport system ATP-binding protein
MIHIRDLEFRYAAGDFQLRIPALDIEHAERVAIIGASGTGKTTLLQLMAGITLPDAGSVQTGSARMHALEDAGRREFRIRNIGLVFQEFELLDYLSVRDNILLPCRINPSLRLDRGVLERAEALAHRVEIADKLGRRPDQLSQGERQRVAVCRALIAEPELLLADEPTGNLDPVNAARVLDILFGYAEERGATLVTVTHDHDLLGRFSRVIDFKRFLPETGIGEAAHGELGSVA